MGKFIFRVRHVTPRHEHFTHIYGVSQEIDVKTFIFSVNLGM